ncbi:MAG TPA: hypothetical protein VMU02_09640 [bacterium]|nr:hypothetical protein [bacterium]
MSNKFDDERISEALDLLNEVAKDKKAELREMIHTKYADLRSAVGGAAGKAQHDVSATYHHSMEKVKDIAGELDEGVHRNPWPYIGGTALGCLILGYIMGRSKRS